MSNKILVPWAMPEKGKEVLSKSKAEIIYLHGPRGELPNLEKLIKAVRNTDVVLPRGTQHIPRKVIMTNPNLRGIANYGVGYDNIGHETGNVGYSEGDTYGNSPFLDTPSIDWQLVPKKLYVRIIFV